MNAGQRMLLLLAALFLAPLAASFFLYYGHSGLEPRGRVNQGELLTPARPIPPLRVSIPTGAASADVPAPVDLFRHKWTLLYVGKGSCEERCRKALFDSRQVRLALDRDMVRVQRVFAAAGDCCDFDALRREHPDLIVIRADAGAAPLLARLPGVQTAGGGTPGAAVSDSGRLYVIDPLSNLVLSYAPQVPAKGLLEDLKRLLKLSQIG